MTQDCLDSPSTASVSQRLPKGIHIIGADKPSAPRVETIPIPKHSSYYEDVAQQSTSWSYLFIHHMAVKSFQKWLEAYNADNTRPTKQPFFIHQATSYAYKNAETQRGVKKIVKPTISGLVFLQGTVKSIQKFLSHYFSSVPLSERPLSRASSLHTRHHHAALYERTESPPRASHPPQRPHREVRQRPREAPRPHRSLQRLRRLHHPHRPQPPTRLRLRRPRRRTQRRAPGRF